MSLFARQPAGEAGAARQDVDAGRFKELKPICVELLSQCSPRAAAHPRFHAHIHQLLQRLASHLQRYTLEAPGHVTPHSPHVRLIHSSPALRHPISLSLINYVFYPLAQLLNSDADSHSSSLPDAIRQSLFQCLALLAHDWWVAFAPTQDGQASGSDNDRWKVWHQLLVLGLLALAGPPGLSQQSAAPSASQETQATILDFLTALLAPRVELGVPEDGGKRRPAPATEWEWDGVQDLPLQGEEDTVVDQRTKGPPQQDTDKQRYPCAAHVEHALKQGSSKGALAHAMSTALDIASGTDRRQDTATATRVRAVSLARVIFVTWLCGARVDVRGELCHLDKDGKSSQKQLLTAHTMARRASVFLPGYVSSMTRTAVGKPRTAAKELSKGSGDIQRTPGALVAAALLALKDALLIRLADQLGYGSQAAAFSPVADASAEAPAGDLASLVQSMQVVQHSAPIPPIEQPVRGAASAATSDPSLASSSDSLQNTLERIDAALAALSGAVHHHHASAQLAAIEVVHQLLVYANATLDWCQGGTATSTTGYASTARMLFVWLLDIFASQSAATVVKEAASDALKALTDKEQVLSARLARWAETELSESLRRLPTAILTHDDEQTVIITGRLGALVRCLSQDPQLTSKLVHILSSPAVMDRLTGQLLPAIELGRVDQAAEKASYITLRHVERLSTSATLDMLQDVGQSLASASQQTEASASRQDRKDAFQLVSHFLALGKSARTSLGTASASASNDRRRSASALLVASQLLRGVARVLGDETTRASTGRGGKRARKTAHRLAREATNIVIDIWEADQDQLLVADQGDGAGRGGGEAEVLGHELSASAAPSAEVEHYRGLAQDHGPPSDVDKSGAILDLSYVDSAHLATSSSAPARRALAARARDEAKEQLQCGDVLLFSIIASCSELLGVSFRPLLLHTLYTLVCGLASSSAAVAQAASTTLQRVARACAYPDVQSLVLQHADYVLGAASHRLVAGLGPELQAVAANANRMQHEGIQEDRRYPGKLVQKHHSTATVLPFSHALTPLNSAQTAPLVLVEVLRLLGSEALPLVEDAVDEVLDALDRYHGYEELCNGLLGLLDRMLEVMATEKSRTKAAATSSYATVGTNAAPSLVSELDSFEKWYRRRKALDGDANPQPAPIFEPATSNDESANSTSLGPDEDPSAPTRTQLVTSNVLAKCVPFLSHASPLLRVTVLRLLRRGVCILAPQGREAEILAVINPAWPVLLTRLGSPVVARSSARRGASGEQLLERLTEREPAVWVESAKLMEEVATHLPDFLGKKIVDEVWPRLDHLLNASAALQKLESRRRVSRPATFILSSDSPHASHPRPASPYVSDCFQHFPEHSTIGRLLQSVASIMSALTRHMNMRMTNQTAWKVLRQAQLLCALDARQPKAVSEAAKSLLETMKQRDADLVWAVWWSQSSAPSADANLDVAWAFEDVLSSTRVAA